jgi:hypothetical protein
LYEDLFFTALARFRDEEGLGQRKKKFRFKNERFADLANKC